MSVCVVVRAMYCANTDELQMIIVVAEVSVAVAEKRILQISACIRWIVFAENPLRVETFVTNFKELVYFSLLAFQHCIGYLRIIYLP